MGRASGGMVVSSLIHVGACFDVDVLVLPTYTGKTWLFFYLFSFLGGITSAMSTLMSLFPGNCVPSEMLTSDPTESPRGQRRGKKANMTKQVCLGLCPMCFLSRDLGTFLVATLSSEVSE